MKKQLTNTQISKMMKLNVDVLEVHSSVWEFICDVKKYDFALEAEAQFLADLMKGTANGYGMQPEKRHYSGLGKLVNAKLTDGWKVKEMPEGNGFSMYQII